MIEIAAERVRACALGAIIASLRKQRRLTQIELADRADSSQGVISRFEQGEKIPSAYTLGRIATALKTTIGDIMDLTDQAVAATERAAESICPGALARPNIDPTGLVRFVVAAREELR